MYLAAQKVLFTIIIVQQVNPVYLAAQKALNSLHVNDIEELKSYPSPPAQVKLLTNALCLMMGTPQT